MGPQLAGGEWILESRPRPRQAILPRRASGLTQMDSVAGTLLWLGRCLVQGRGGSLLPNILCFMWCGQQNLDLPVCNMSWVLPPEAGLVSPSVHCLPSTGKASPVPPGTGQTRHPHLHMMCPQRPGQEHGLRIFTFCLLRLTFPFLLWAFRLTDKFQRHQRRSPITL